MENTRVYFFDSDKQDGDVIEAFDSPSVPHFPEGMEITINKVNHAPSEWDVQNLNATYKVVRSNFKIKTSYRSGIPLYKIASQSLFVYLKKICDAPTS